MTFRSLAENSAVAATELVNALQHLASDAPYTHIGDKQMEALQQLAEIFNAQPSNSIPTNYNHISFSHLPRPIPKLCVSANISVGLSIPVFPKL